VTSDAAPEGATDRRVVITSLGVLHSLGHTSGEIWEAMAEGRSGIGPITRFDASGFDTRIAAEIKLEGDDRFRPEYWDALDRRSQYAVSAALTAVQRGGLSFTPQNRGQVAVVLASERPEEESLVEGRRLLEAGDIAAAAESLAPHARPHAPSERVAAMLGTTGPVLQLENRSAGGLNAIVEAAEMIRRGDALIALAGGVEAPITPLTLAAFQGTGALSTRNDEPAAAGRPLDTARDGFVLAEGAAIFALEALEVAVARGATILAEIEGHGATFSPGEDGHPGADPTQIGQAIQLALVNSGRIQSEVDVLMLHAAGTRDGDVQEAIGVRRIFGGSTRHHMYTPAPKSHLGHALGASGPLALAVLLEAIHRQEIPGTRNLDEEDPEVDLDANPGAPRADAVLVAMVNATGWAHNACLAICAPRAMREIPDFEAPEVMAIPSRDVP